MKPASVHPRFGRRHARAYVLLPVAIVIALIACIAYLSGRESTLGVNMTANEFDALQAEYVVQAGLQHALRDANQGSCSAYALNTTPFGAHSYQAVFSPNSGSPVKIAATGTLQNGVSRSLTRGGVRLYQSPLTSVKQPGPADGVDTHLYQWKSNWNFGADKNLVVYNDSDSDEHGLLQFDLSNLPPTADIVSATLDLYSNSNAWDVVTVDVHRVTGAWVEGSLDGQAGTGATWDQADAGSPWTSGGGDYDPGIVASTVVPNGLGWSSWDVSPLVRDWVAGTAVNHGLLLRTQQFSKGAQFNSSDATNPALRPRLTVVYVCECGVGANPSLDVLQPGPAIAKDTSLHGGGQASKNYGQATPVWVDNQVPHRSLFEFDLSYLPVGITITDAKLDLYVDGIDVVTTADVGVYRITQAWIEGSGGNSGLTPADGATFATYDGLTPWATAGGDYDPASGKTITVNSIDAQWYQWDVTAMVTGWVDGTDPNHGFLLRGDAGYLEKMNVTSSDSGDFSKRPRLTLTYDCPCGMTCTPPPSASGKSLLFVVGDDTTLTTGESAYLAMFEYWGFIVQVIDDGAPQADYDTAISANLVAFASADMGADQLVGKLTGAPIGVVYSEVQMSNVFGIATGIVLETDNQLTITRNSHYITSPYSLGALSTSAVGETMAYLNGTVAPDLLALASSSSGIALAALDAGATMAGGGSTAGRRVQLPWAGNNFDPNSLNTDGIMLLRRALEWGAGVGADSSPVAHWKFDETSGLIAQDSAADNDGTLNGVPDWAPALIDGGLDFDGSNDYIDAGAFDVSGSGITMMGWFNATTLATDDPQIISKANGTNEADAWWQLGTVDSGSNRFLRMRIKAGATTTTLADTSFNLATGQWYLAAATYDNASGEMKLYLDGVEIANASHATGGNIDTDATVPVTLGANDSANRFFNGILDDLWIYDYPLAASDVAELFAASPPPGSARYTEQHQPWSATVENAWETVDLAAFGVPAHAVVEVAVINSDASGVRSGGVRALGSSLERRFELHEAESGGLDAVTMHVQANASSRIQHYSSKATKLTFVLLGYWTGAIYVESFDAFKAGANASWQPHDLGAYGVGANQVAEIALSQTSTSIEWLVGARRSGSSLARQLTLHEAESGGIDVLTLQVASDASAAIEVYAGADSVVDFHLLGYWSTPPGTYTEQGGVSGQVSTLLTWEINDLSSFGVPADAIAQFVVANESLGAEVQIGVRETGSPLQRVLELHEAEGGGSDLLSMHVKVDASAQVEWYSEFGGGTRFFYPVGWWDLSP